MTALERNDIELMINEGVPMLQIAEILDIDPDWVEQVMEEIEAEVEWDESTM